MNNSGVNQIEASAEDYLEHAKEVNAIAGTALHMGRKDVFTLSKKISLGLSLQAVELVGKGMLRALGHSVQQIRQQHGKHDLLTLLKHVELELQQRPEPELVTYHHFLLWTPTIDGIK